MSPAAAGIAKGAAAMMKVAMVKMFAAVGACAVLVLGVGGIGGGGAESERRKGSGGGGGHAFGGAGDNRRPTAEVWPRRAQITYRAAVVDEQGKPVAGARVRSSG